MRNKGAVFAHRLARTRLWRWAWQTDHDDKIPATMGLLVQCALVVALIVAQTPAAFTMMLATPAIVLSLMVTTSGRRVRR